MSDAAPKHVLVIGGGPAGTSAALQARQLGADVTLLEADRVGGTSLNRGPAPVRTLARAARLARDWTSWDQFGLRGPRPRLDLDAVLANSARATRHAHDVIDLAGLIRGLGIDLIERLGPVRFADPHTIQASDGRHWQGHRVILAVGGHAAPLPVPGSHLALHYDDLHNVKALPDEVMVVGGADTGCQIASILDDFGVKVRLVEFGPTLVPAADPSVSGALRAAFEAQGMQISTGTRVTELAADGDRVVVRSVRDGKSDEATVGAVFAAVGWPGNLDGLGLDAAGINHDGTAIPVDEYLRTNVEDVFAVGDLNGSSKLVQTARLEGRAAAWNAVRGPARRATHDIVPSASFTDPEYGAVGLTEPQAVRDHDVVVGIARYDDLLRPVADGHPDGFCKLIVDRATHHVLGGHVLGESSAETVQVVATAMSARMSVEELADMQFAFPTYTEAVSMAAQKVCRTIGIGEFPLAWNYLADESSAPVWP
jgi:pyruvate/2-oxoglutarate dehydrogenase complex dihydrolipoamide dehydrogenase (E3) component